MSAAERTSSLEHTDRARERLRVLVAPHSLELGGSQINALELVEKMAGDPRLELMLYAPDGVLADRARAAGLPLHLTRLRESAPSALRMRELWRLARRWRADLVHTYEWMPTVDAVFAVAAGRGIPVISTVLSMDYPYLLPRDVPLVLGTQQLVERARTEGRRAYLLEPPIDTDMFRPGALPHDVIAATRAECGAGDGDTLVVVVGRLAQMLKLEGLLALVDAVGIVAASRRVRLCIVGDGPSRGPVEERAARVNAAAGRDVVRLLGERMDPLPYYLAGDMAVGMGGSALRAMATGRPLLVQGERGFWAVADRSTEPDFLRQGWYGVGAGDRAIERCVEQLTRLLDADRVERDELARFGRELVLERYSLARAASALTDIYLREHADAKPGWARRVAEPLTLSTELAKSAVSIRVPGLRHAFLRATGRAAAAQRARPKFSVVIPCYNYIRYIDEAIESALAQEGVDVEVVVIDDASTDGSRERAEHWARRDSRVQVRKHETNHGHIATFNEALASATGEFVVKLDADDVLTPGSLRRSADVLVAHPRVSLVYGGVEHVQGELPTATSGRVSSVRIWSGQDWLMRVAQCPHNPISQPEVVIRRSALAEAGGHRSEVPGTSDLHLWLCLAATGDVAYIRGAVQGLYRIHGASMRATIHSGLVYDLRARRDAFELFLRERAGSIRDADRFACSFRRALAADALLNARSAFEGGRDPRPLLAEARAADADVVRTRLWRTTKRQLDGRRGIGIALGRVRRDLDARIRWHRRRLWGV